MLRPINPKKFLKSYNIKFSSFHSNMTNGAILSFKNKKILNAQIKKIKKINLYGYRLFETKILNNHQIFCRIQVRSKKNNFTKNSKKNIFCDNNQKILINNIDDNFLKFNKNIAFIKTTSQHIPEGQLFYRSINIKRNKIENIKIYELIKDFFK